MVGRLRRLRMRECRRLILAVGLQTWEPFPRCWQWLRDLPQRQRDDGLGAEARLAASEWRPPPGSAGLCPTDVADRPVPQSYFTFSGLPARQRLLMFSSIVGLAMDHHPQADLGGGSGTSELGHDCPETLPPPHAPQPRSPHLFCLN